MNDDQSLSDTTPPASSHGSHAGGSSAFERASIGRPDLDAPSTPLTVEQILEIAKLPERRAEVCLKPDLQARFDELVSELSTLVNDRGELLEEAEASLGESTAKSRAIEISDEIESVRKEMAGSMWRPLFRGKTSDDLAVFNKKHYPENAKPGTSLAEYYNLLIAECAVEPPMTVEGVKAMRAKLGHKAISSLVETANRVNVGGIDVPKSPISSLALTER